MLDLLARITGGNVLTADSVGSGGETRHQHYNELGAGKLDSVYLQSIPADEAKRAGYFSGGWMRLSPRLNRHRLTDRTPRPKITTAK